MNNLPAMASCKIDRRNIPGWVWMTGVLLLSIVLIIIVWWYYHQRIEALDKILEI
jgi:hypothetical protein